jgi:hypothetical protein
MNKTTRGTEVQQRVANTWLSGLDLLGKDLNLRIKDVGSHQTEIQLLGLVTVMDHTYLNTMVTLLYSYDTLVAVSKLQSSVTGEAVNYPTDEWPIPIRFYKVKLSEHHETRTTSKHIRQFLERQLDITSHWEHPDDRDWLEREAKKLTIEIPIDFAAAITTIQIVGLKWN